MACLARGVLYLHEGAFLPGRHNPMQRREFLLGSAAAACPLAAHAQAHDMRPIDFLTGLPTNDVERQARPAKFLDGLAQLGWIVARNLEIDDRASGRYP